MKRNNILFGAHAIIEMLKAKRRKLISLYTLKQMPKSFLRVKPYLPSRIGNIQYLSRNELDRLAGTTDHGGVVALVSDFVYVQKMFDPKKQPFVLLLDAVQDVRNVGAILRSAYCSGVDGVVLCQKNSAPLTASAIKASAGLAEHLLIHRASSIKQAVHELRRAGYNLYMAVLSGGENALEVSYKQPACLVIGNEESGITKALQDQGSCITLPQKTADISYNASVAAGILLFVLRHRMSI